MPGSVVPIAAVPEPGIAVLQIRGARKRFGETTALDGADLTLHAREWLGLLGPNGAGKTTLIRAVSGRVRLDQGEIQLLGEVVGRSSGFPSPLSRRESPMGGGERGEIGVVPQDIALYPLLTARENLAAFGALHGLAGARLSERVAWALSWTGLEERGRQSVKTFSGGMKRRLNLACGVLHQPDVVLLDEPTVGVDPQSRQRIWEMLAELRAAGAALLLTTHQLDEAQQVCDRIAILDHGRTIAAGTFDQLLATTVGRGRRIIVHLDRVAPAQLSSAGLAAEGTTLHGQVENLANELPRLLARISETGAVVEDIEIAAPNLQAVFLHLTGRELRE
jgi:ABC-2 type transport system ATP-binding protein